MMTLRPHPLVHITLSLMSGDLVTCVPDTQPLPPTLRQQQTTHGLPPWLALMMGSCIKDKAATTRSSVYSEQILREVEEER